MTVNPHPSNDAHRLNQPLLSEYAHTLALGLPMNATMAQVAEHVHQCAACQSELFTLVDASFAFYADALPPITSPQKTTTPYKLNLEPPIPTHHSSFIIQFSEALLHTIRESRQMLGALRSNRQLIGIYRQSAINIPDIKIELYEAEAQHALLHCYIQNAHKDAFDQSGTDIVVYAEGQAWNGTTDADGFVEISGIPIRALGEMRIEIMTV